MNDDDKKKPDGPTADDQRTVFIPKQQEPDSPAEAPQDASPWGGPPDEGAAPADDPVSSGWDAPEAADPEPEDDDRTRFEASPSVPPPPPPPQEPTGFAAGRTSMPMAPRTNADGGIQVGDVLNHIFEVKRFIARGGMGEVFEGVNVNSDERVAIKVMLPSLASDPNVISMFRREARTLTRLQHEALVQYRVLAQEPQLGVLYIVTEYIDGVPLSDVLGTINATPEDLELILARLAAGLRAAHALDLLHRDMSPDNVLLEGRRLAGAKIIDFGIAKDLDPGSSTIIGDGFAGKLGYVAPEQLGDFNREMGPWTDVYSLGLVILAVAMGRDVQMGGTLVDAVDKRRAGPDLSAIPERIRPVVQKMLAPNPAERFRSMDEVLQALQQLGGGAAAAVAKAEGGSGGLGAIPKPALIGGGAVLAALLAGGIWIAISGGDEGGGNGAGPGPAVVASSDPAQAARQAIDGAIPSIGCSWLDIVDVGANSGQVSVNLGGVAGSPSAAQSEIASALGAAGLANANIDFGQVATISPGGCAAIDTYRQIRNTEAPRIATEQRMWEMRKQPEGASYEGRDAANVVARMNIGDPSLDLTLFGIDPAGILYPFLQRVGGQKTAYFEGEPPVSNWDDAPITQSGNDSYTINVDLDHEGWQGFVLVTGKGPFPQDIVMPGLGTRNTAWQQKFMQAASRQGWKADMTWFRAVDQRPGD